MDPFSYICVLTSIVAGLAVTRLVSSFGQLLQTRARTAALLGARALDGERAFNNDHHLVGANIAGATSRTGRCFLLSNARVSRLTFAVKL